VLFRNNGDVLERDCSEGLKAKVDGMRVEVLERRKEKQLVNTKFCPSCRFILLYGPQREKDGVVIRGFEDRKAFVSFPSINAAIGDLAIALPVVEDFLCEITAVVPTKYVCRESECVCLRYFR